MTLTNDTITNKYRSLKYIYQYKTVFDKPDEQSPTCLNCHGEKTWAPPTFLISQMSNLKLV